MSVKEIFLAAPEKAVPAQRNAFLEEARASDTPLRRCVQTLLRANDEPGRFLEMPAALPDHLATDLPFSRCHSVSERQRQVIVLWCHLARARRTDPVGTARFLFPGRPNSFLVTGRR
jgi:hypothetical protein